jgi:two-component system, OmpR family, sensor histidine kinase VicK
LQAYRISNGSSFDLFFPTLENNQIMAIHHSGKQFSFGQNIHLAYDINKGELLFVHQSLEWLWKDQSNADVLKVVMAQIPGDNLTLAATEFQKLINGNFEGSFTLHIDTANGLKLLRITPVIPETKSLILATIEDITDDFFNQETLIKYANKKNSILHMLAHDLRGPLGVATNLVKTLDQQAVHPDASTKTSYIVSILEQSIHLIDDLVEREFLETTAATLVRKRTNLADILSGYVEECKRSSAIAKRSFHYNSSTQELYADIDNSKFMQILNNLISNAIKFTHEGGTITITLTEKTDTLMFTVSDNGIGIPEDLMPFIFDKFSQAARPGLNGEPTIGLGLSIVKTIVEWHEGEISCESKEAEGTTFIVNLPKSV